MLPLADPWLPPSPRDGLATPTRYPIYIVSKGRAEYPLTIRGLSYCRVPFNVVVEADEAEAYRDVVAHYGGYGRVLVLDPIYVHGYEALTDLRDDEPHGSGPARNFAWDHAVSEGHAYYWCMDDNITGFWYYAENRKIHAGDATPVLRMEEFARRYSNVAMAGPTYYMFVARKNKYPPFVVNRRVYSCNLIRTDLPFRWRGRYNEDTILSLDLLKAGWNTILFNAYLQWKTSTLLTPGGNTDTIYAVPNAHLLKAQMLVSAHPDVSRVALRFGRTHHYVDYSPFAKRALVRFPDAPPMSPLVVDTRARPRPQPLPGRAARLFREDADGNLHLPESDDESEATA